MSKEAYLSDIGGDHAEDNLCLQERIGELRVIIQQFTHLVRISL